MSRGTRDVMSIWGEGATVLPVMRFGCILSVGRRRAGQFVTRY